MEALDGGVPCGNGGEGGGSAGRGRDGGRSCSNGGVCHPGKVHVGRHGRRGVLVQIRSGLRRPGPFASAVSLAVRGCGRRSLGCWWATAVAGVNGHAALQLGLAGVMSWQAVAR